MPRRVLPLLLALTSCAGGGAATLGQSAGVQCAPFARALTGVALYGPADSWWQAADGRYVRTDVPQPGSLLVFTRSPRLPSGHVSVVAGIISSREILLTQANWLHGRIGLDQPALDVSPANDWTSVRVFWPPSHHLGTTAYPTYGFIIPESPPTHARITARVPQAIEVAERGFD